MSFSFLTLPTVCVCVCVYGSGEISFELCNCYTLLYFIIHASWFLLSALRDAEPLLPLSNPAFIDRSKPLQ